MREIRSTAIYPLSNLSAEFTPFLEATELVQSTHPKLKNKALEIVRKSELQIEVVQAVLRFIVDHLHYDLHAVLYHSIDNLKIFIHYINDI